MHIKFLSHGKGNPDLAVTYLTAGHDYKGARRPDVLVLRGDPLQVAMVVDTLPQLHRYTSGVIAWSLEDSPTPSEVEDVLDDFERVAFAGLRRDRFSYTAIRHSDHVHLFVAKVDLLTCKSFNIAPPGWKSDFYPLRDFWNFKKGWARPDDPKRARLLAKPLRYYSAAVAKKIEEDLAAGYELVDIQTALDVEPDPEFFIAQWLIDLIYERKILTYQDVLSELSRQGTVEQVNKSTLNFLPDRSDQVIKLCGRLFATDFNVQEVFDRPAIRELQWSGRETPNLALAQAELTKLGTVIEKRSEYNIRTYKPKVWKAALDRTPVQDLSSPSLPVLANKTSSRAGRAMRALAAAKNAIEKFKKLLIRSFVPIPHATTMMSDDESLKLKRAFEAKSVIPVLAETSTLVKNQTQKPR